MRNEVINQPSGERFLRPDVRPNSVNAQCRKVPVRQNSYQLSCDHLLLYHAKGEVSDAEPGQYSGLGGIYLSMHVYGGNRTFTTAKRMATLPAMQAFIDHKFCAMSE